MSSDKMVEERFKQMADEITALKVELTNVNVELANANEIISRLQVDLANNDQQEIGLNQSKYNQKDCVICLSSLYNSKICCYLPCFHAFHIACMDSWVKKSHLCPICRHPWKLI